MLLLQKSVSIMYFSPFYHFFVGRVLFLYYHKLFSPPQEDFSVFYGRGKDKGLASFTLFLAAATGATGTTRILFEKGCSYCHYSQYCYCYTNNIVNHIIPTFQLAFANFSLILTCLFVNTEVSLKSFIANKHI